MTVIFVLSSLSFSRSLTYHFCLFLSYLHHLLSSSLTGNHISQHELNIIYFFITIKIIFLSLVLWFFSSSLSLFIFIIWLSSSLIWSIILLHFYHHYFYPSSYKLSFEMIHSKMVQDDVGVDQMMKMISFIIFFTMFWFIIDWYWTWLLMILL